MVTRVDGSDVRGRDGRDTGLSETKDCVLWVCETSTDLRQKF